MTDLLIYIDPTILLSAGILLLVLWIIRLEVKISRLLKGKNAKSLEGSILSLIDEQKNMSKFRKEMEVYLENVEKRLRKSVRGVDTIRFNPFKGAGGGNQSFATAFIDEEGNGVMLSSIYSRDRMSVFAKPIEKFNSSFDLSEEEKTAISKAKTKMQ